MKIIISCIIILTIFPILDISYRAYGLNTIISGISIIMYLILSIMVTLIVYLGRVFIKSKNRKTILMVISLGISVLLGIIYSLVISNLSMVYWIISSVILGFIIQRVFYLDTQKFCNVYVFMVVSIVYLACTFMGWQTELGSLKGLNSILYLIFCAIFGILVNRTKLENVIYRRSQNLDSIPKNIFRYNSKLTVLLCLIPLPIVIFSNRIGSALYDVLISIFKGIIYIGKLISRLFAKEPTEIETIEEESNGFQPKYMTDSSIVWDILDIVIIVLLIYLIYKYHEDIIRKFKEIINDLKSRLKDSLLDNNTVIEMPSSEGYTDYIKDIPSRYNKKSFKKDYKKYLKMETSTDTILFGYNTFINGLNLLNYNIKPFDTITEVSKKFDCQNFSNIYLSIRYNQAIPSANDRLLLNDLLQQIYKRL